MRVIGLAALFVMVLAISCGEPERATPPTAVPTASVITYFDITKNEIVEAVTVFGYEQLEYSNPVVLEHDYSRIRLYSTLSGYIREMSISFDIDADMSIEEMTGISTALIIWVSGDWSWLWEALTAANFVTHSIGGVDIKATVNGSIVTITLD